MQGVFSSEHGTAYKDTHENDVGEVGMVADLMTENAEPTRSVNCDR